MIRTKFDGATCSGGEFEMSNSSALNYARRALSEVPGRMKIKNDQEQALRELADAVENLARAVIELAR